ncbi:MAG TPA: protein kinase [Thermoanaerobaculia bacterium]|nr:protein kinase [Thermoanaerobaculia bacterium]
MDPDPVPPRRVATRTDGQEASLAPGSCLGPYQVVELLGAGGMGEVYRARDPRLRREVAVKVLSRHCLADQERLRRFEHEARAAGALNHPNILAVFDIGAQDGVPYVVTELLEGETLKERMHRGPLPLRECLGAARQLAAGLATAHDKGIVHRDLKPANLFLTRDGRMKILDFGLAKQLAAGEDSTLGTGATLPGTVLGTVGYMSPEQVQGRDVDHRSDLFSFGAVVYEMLAGSRAFAGPSAVETMLAILTREPPPMPAARAVPPAFERLVRRCLSKDLAARPQLTSELCACLDDLAHSFDSGAGIPTGPAAAAAAATGAPGSAPASAPPSRHAVAVLPFANLTGDPDQDYFCEGMVDELTNSLVRLEGFQVARLSVSRLRGKSAEVIRRIGERLRVDKVLQGTVRKAGARLRVTVQLVNVADGYHVWSASYDREMADVFAVQDEIALRVAEALRLRLAGTGLAPRAPRPAGDPEAYHLYLRGRYHWNKRIELKEGLRCFEQAIEKDPGYAPAYAGLADSYAMMGYTAYSLMPPHQAMPRARAAAQRALEIDPELADAHACLGFVHTCYDWNWAAAEADFQRALALDPGGAMTHQWYSVFLMTQGRFDTAIAEAQRAWELDPLSPGINAYQVVVAGWAKRFPEQEAEELYKLVELEPELSVGRLFLGYAYTLAGKYGDAIDVLQAFASPHGGHPLAWAGVAYSRGRSGDRDAARRALGELHAAAGQRHVSAWYFAMVHAGLGESDEAFSYLDQAVAERAGLLAHLGVDQAFDPLRGDARFDALLRRIGLAVPGGASQP